MSIRRKVRIVIESESRGQHLQQPLEADLYKKNDAVYYRYQEPDPAMGSTITTVKVKSDEIKIIRHGHVQSEQTFIEQQSVGGYYYLPEAKLHLQTQTHRLSNRLDSDGLGTLSWVYDLYMDEEHAGTYELKLDIREA